MQTIKWPKIVIPGIVWGFILVAATIILKENFPNWEYLPWIIVVINAIIKAIEVNIGQPIPRPDEAQMRAMDDSARVVVEEPSKLRRFFVA